MSGYDGGGASRASNVLKSWQPRWLSAGSDIDLNLDTLRNRAADLARNTAIGAAAIGTSARATIGSGLKLFPRADAKMLGLTQEQAREWNRTTAAEFALWSSTVDCDLFRRNNFGDLQYIAYTSYLTDGDVFCLFRRKAPTRRNPYSLRLQLVEGNRISTPTENRMGVVEGRAANGNRIISGIEIAEDGELKAIYVSNRVPNDVIGRDVLTTWARVAAFGAAGYPNLLQISHDVRPGQYRGVPYLASVIEPMKQVSRYTNAELTSALIKTFFALFFVQQDQNFGINEMLDKQKREETEEEDAEIDVTEYKLGMGTMTALPRGVDVKTVESGQTQSAFAGFVDKLTQQIGSALGIPAEVLNMSFNSSYSASRAALLQANDEFQQRRKWFIRDFCRPIYQCWLEEAVAIGRIDAPGFFEDARMRAAWSECDWHGPVMSSLDPLKEMQAAQLRVQSGVSTWQREAAELCGADFEQNVEQLKYERDLMGEEKQ